MLVKVIHVAWSFTKCINIYELNRIRFNWFARISHSYHMVRRICVCICTYNWCNIESIELFLLPAKHIVVHRKKFHFWQLFLLVSKQRVNSYTQTKPHFKHHITHESNKIGIKTEEMLLFSHVCAIFCVYASVMMCSNSKDHHSFMNQLKYSLVNFDYENSPDIKKIESVHSLISMGSETAFMAFCQLSNSNISKMFSKYRIPGKIGSFIFRWRKHRCEYMWTQI